MYVKRYTGQINALQNWAEFAGGHRPVASITKEDFMLWTQSEMRRGLLASSLQRRINSIRAAINYARDVFPDLSNYSLPKFSVGKEADRKRMRILEESEIVGLSKKFKENPEWRDAFDFFRIALGCGGRFDEIVPVVVRRDLMTAGIKWTDINKKQQLLRLFSHKTGKERLVYVPAVIEILLQRKADGLGNKTHAFEHLDHWFRARFETVSESCEIPYGQQVPGGWTIHDLRHTCLTNLLQSGVDIATVRDFAGHHSITETSRYVHPTEQSRKILANASAGLIAIAS